MESSKLTLSAEIEHGRSKNDKVTIAGIPETTLSEGDDENESLGSSGSSFESDNSSDCNSLSDDEGTSGRKRKEKGVTSKSRSNSKHNQGKSVRSSGASDGPGGARSYSNNSNGRSSGGGGGGENALSKLFGKKKGW